MHPIPTTVPWSAQLATPHPLPSRHMRRVSKLMGSHPRSRDLLSSSPSCPCILLFLFLLISFVWVETCGEVFRNDLTPSFQSLPRTFLACRINLFFLLVSFFLFGGSSICLVTISCSSWYPLSNDPDRTILTVPWGPSLSNYRYTSMKSGW